jgi:hypothetical protein
LQAALTKNATVSLRTVAAFERGEITPLPNNLSAMQRTFEKAGLWLLFDRKGLLPAQLVRLQRST